MSSEEEALRIELATATTAEARGRIHAALAVCACRALEYRTMNYHEDASARAYAEQSSTLREAHGDYRAAMQAFSDGKTHIGIELLRRACPVIVAELGDRHPYAHQVINTLLGRVPGMDICERLALRRWLVEHKRAMYGPEHTHTLQHLGNLAYLLAAAGEHEEAMAAFEEAIDGLAAGPWPDHAGPLLRRSSELCRAAGTPARTWPRERLVLQRAPSQARVVREVFLGRRPEAAVVINASALRHGAEHFAALREAAFAVVDADDEVVVPQVIQRAATADSNAPASAFARAIDAFVEHRAGMSKGERPLQAAEWVLAALAGLDEVARAEQHGPDACDDHDDAPEGPLERAERERQDALLDAG
jgi:tetratricopeptide (TPR) repeat protein